MRAFLAEIVRFFAWVLALLSGMPLSMSRRLYRFADWLEGRP